MNIQRKFLSLSLAILALCGFWSSPASAMVDDSQSYALEAATPYIEEGFSMRYEFWDGQIKNGEQHLVRHQLFKGNEYWFWTATDILEAKISIHAYDENGELVEAESWQKGNVAAVRVTPQKTGTYFLMVTVEEVPEDTEATWTVAYAYR